MIVTKDLTKTYANGYRAVDNLSLLVEEGDIYGYLGPNGAGKTTTIRMLTGLLQPTQGQIWIQHMDMTLKEREIKRIIGVLPESHGYYPWMTGEEYLNYFASLFEIDLKERKTYIPTLLEMVGLTDRKKRIGHYSRGMRQRLGIAKTLINRPKIIFLDEPTLGLDPMGQKDIQNLVRGLNKTMGVTVFITSHLLKDIEVLCNKVAIVQNGKLIEQGEIQALQVKYGAPNIYKIRTSDNTMVEAEFKGSTAFDKLEQASQALVVYPNPKISKEEFKKHLLSALFSVDVDIYEIGKAEASMEDIFFKIIEEKQ